MYLQGPFFAMQIIFEHSSAWLLLLIPLAAFLSFGLYYYKPSIKSERVRLALASLRFISLVLLAILCLNPLWEQTKTYTEKPSIVVLQDASSSMLNYSDSNNLKHELARWMNLLPEELEEFDWQQFSFSKSLNPGIDTSFAGSSSNFSDNFSKISDRFAAKKPAAMVLISDGNFNRGMNPLIAAEQFSFPVFTLGIGDTTVYPDSRIVNVLHNEISYLDNSFPVSVLIESNSLAGKSTSISIFSGNKRLAKKSILLQDDSQQRVDFLLDATKVGFQEFRVELNPQGNEPNTKNNFTSFRIEVLDSKKKVLLLAAVPHPDVKALRQSLSGLKNLELEVKVLGEPVDLKQYQALIMHQIPSSLPDDDALTESLKLSKTPVWFILGQRSDIRALNRIQSLINIQQRSTQFDDVRPAFNEEFSSFTIPQGIESALSFSPPLKAPFGEYELTGAVDVLAYQKLGTVKSKRPLWFTGANEGRKLMFTAAEGIWRWPLYLNASNQEEELFPQLIEKSMQLLSSETNKDRFRLNFPRQIEEQEPFKIQAELYNKAFERVVGPALNIAFTDEQGREYQFLFNQLAESYSLKVPALEPGIYTFNAKLSLGDENFEKKGSFIVKASSRENKEIVANHQLLKDLAKNTRGRYYNISARQGLIDELKKASFAKPILYQQKQLSTIIESKWILLILLGFFSLEWLLRKRFGKY